MRIIVRDNREYDQGVHPEATQIVFCRSDAGDFFKDDRFPNLVKLDCSHGKLKTLSLNCSSLQELWCYDNLLTRLELNCPSLLKVDCSHNRLVKLGLNCPALRMLACIFNQLTQLELNCPFLQRLYCYDNRLTKLELNCPSLQELWCFNNQLSDLNGLEFCADLKELRCSIALKESAEILKVHLPELYVRH